MKTIKVNIMDLNTPSKASGRVYSKEVMEQAINEFNAREIKGGILGEVQHISQPLQLADISHKIEDMHIEENKVVATIDILDTVSGNNLKTLLESDVKLAMAPRIEINEEEVINENGTPIKQVTKVNILSVDCVLDKDKAFEDNTIKVED